MKKPIIGFCGYAQVGKDTAAQALVKQGWTKVAFADEVKRDLWLFINENFGWDIYNLTPEAKDIIRPIMVEYACAKRKLDQDYWVKELWANYIDCIEPKVGWVISDVRYFNEHLAITRYAIHNGGIVFGIYRPEYGPINEQEKKYTTLVLKHIQAACEGKLIIDNNGSIEDLHKTVLERVEWAKQAGLLLGRGNNV